MTAMSWRPVFPAFTGVYGSYGRAKFRGNCMPHDRPPKRIWSLPLTDRQRRARARWRAGWRPTIRVCHISTPDHCTGRPDCCRVESCRWPARLTKPAALEAAQKPRIRRYLSAKTSSAPRAQERRHRRVAAIPAVRSALLEFQRETLQRHHAGRCARRARHRHSCVSGRGCETVRDSGAGNPCPAPSS